MSDLNSINSHKLGSQNVDRTNELTSQIPSGKQVNPSFGFEPDMLNLPAMLHLNPKKFAQEPKVELMAPNPSVPLATHVDVENIVKAGANPLLMIPAQKTIVSDKMDVEDRVGSVNKYQSRSASIMILLTEIMQTQLAGKRAEQENTKTMALLNDSAVNATAALKLASGVAAFRGSIVQAALGMTTAGSSYLNLSKASKMDGAIIKHDEPKLMGLKNDRNFAELSLAQGNTSPLQSSAGNIRSQDQAHLEQGAINNLKKDIAAVQHDIDTKRSESAKLRDKGNLLAMLNNPATGVASGAARMAGATIDSQEYRAMNEAQVIAALTDSSTKKTADAEGALQMVLQLLQETSKNHLDNISQMVRA